MLHPLVFLHSVQQEMELQSHGIIYFRLVGFCGKIHHFTTQRSHLLEKSYDFKRLLTFLRMHCFSRYVQFEKVWSLEKLGHYNHFKCTSKKFLVLLRITWQMYCVNINWNGYVTPCQTEALFSWMNAILEKNRSLLFQVMVFNVSQMHEIMYRMSIGS